MTKVMFDDVWDELKNEDEFSRNDFETAEELSRIIIKLVETRVENGYTQRELAQKCGIKQSAIARMESMKTIPRLDTIIRIAHALNIAISLDQVTAQIIGLKQYYNKDVNSLYRYSYKGNNTEQVNIGVEYEVVS